MAAPQPIWIFGLDGLPKADAVPAFVAGALGYFDKTGAARAQPAAGIENRGGGQYILQPTDADEAAGTCAIIDCGVDASPRYQYIDISTNDNQFALYVPFDSDGTLGAGAPTVGAYVEWSTGASRPFPTVVKAGALEAYTITPTAQDAALGVGLRLDSPAGNIPPVVNASFSGSVVPPGTVSTTGGLVGDLCDAVDLMSSGTYTVTRRTPSGYLRGRRVPPFSAVFSMSASVQPASGLEVQRLPEGKRNREVMAVFSCVELQTAASGQEPDLVAIDGGTFEVESVKRWAALGNYYRSVVTRRPAT